MKLVGEIGINHNGSLDAAFQLIDVAVAAGLDYVKFQKRTVAECYTEEFLASPRESPWGTTQGEQKAALELSREDYDRIAVYCKEQSIGWFASVWDTQSVRFLEQYSPPFIKVPSAVNYSPAVLEAVGKTGFPVIMSTGMCLRQDMVEAARLIGHEPAYILACTSTYPTKDEEVNLSFIRTLKNFMPSSRVGFSNHHPGIQYCIAAVALGAEMIEFHMTLDRAAYGSDQASSIEPQGVMALAKHCRNMESALGTGEWTVFASELAIKRKLAIPKAEG